MTTIVTKQHDTQIVFRDTPTIDDVAVPPANLAGCTLSFLLKNGSVSFKRPATINGDGTFSYAPQAADVATAGDYQQEWEVVYPSTKILTFPNGGWNIVKIIPDLG